MGYWREKHSEETSRVWNFTRTVESLEILKRQTESSWTACVWM